MVCANGAPAHTTVAHNNELDLGFFELVDHETRHVGQLSLQLKANSGNEKSIGVAGKLQLTMRDENNLNITLRATVLDGSAASSLMKLHLDANIVDEQGKEIQCNDWYAKRNSKKRSEKFNFLLLDSVAKLFSILILLKTKAEKRLFES